MSQESISWALQRYSSKRNLAIVLWQVSEILVLSSPLPGRLREVNFPGTSSWHWRLRNGNFVLHLRLYTDAERKALKWKKLSFSGSQPLFWERHADPKHLLCRPLQSFNKTSNVLCKGLRSAIKQNVCSDFCYNFFSAALQQRCKSGFGSLRSLQRNGWKPLLQFDANYFGHFGVQPTKHFL